MKLPNLDKFLEKVRIGRHPSMDCWFWLGATNGRYGTLRLKQSKGVYKQFSAHRVSYMLARGVEVPDGYVVMHKCDNTFCVNPAHLRVGTQTDNMADAKQKGKFL